MANVAGRLWAAFVVAIIVLLTAEISMDVAKRNVEARWCAELFAVPQADTLAILRTHDFCEVPR